MRWIVSLVCLSMLSQSSATAQLPQPLTGSLVIVGGGTIPPSVVETFHKLAGGAKAKLVVIPTASASADKDDVKATLDLWEKRGFTNVSLLHTRDRKQANVLMAESKDGWKSLAAPLTGSKRAIRSRGRPPLTLEKVPVA